MSCNYPMIKDFGCNTKGLSNPLSYCLQSPLDSGFSHGLGGNNIAGPDSQQCQRAMAAYGALHWDGACEYLAADTNVSYPNVMKPGTYNGNGITNTLTKGDQFVRNVAEERFMIFMSGNCERKYEPFDPTVADSPLISTWQCKPGLRGACIPIYAIKPSDADTDPVMRRILDKPWIAIDILVNMRNNMGKTIGTTQIPPLSAYRGTRLFNLLSNPMFEEMARTGKY